MTGTSFQHVSTGVPYFASSGFKNLKNKCERKPTSKMYDSSDLTSARVCGSLEMATTSFKGYCKKDVIIAQIKYMKIF